MQNIKLMTKIKLLMLMIACSLFVGCSEDDGEIVNPVFEISESELVQNLGMNAIAFNIQVKTDLPSDQWTVNSNAYWCNARKSGNGNSISITLQANGDAQKRTAIVTASSAVKNYKIQITQRGHGGKPSDVAVEGDIQFNPTSGVVNQHQGCQGIEKTWDDDLTGANDNHYHSPWNNGTKFPVELEYFFDGKQNLDYIIYYSRSGNVDIPGVHVIRC